MNLDGREFPIYFANDDQTVCYKIINPNYYQCACAQVNGNNKNFQMFESSDCPTSVLPHFLLDKTECDATVFESLVKKALNYFSKQI